MYDKCKQVSTRLTGTFKDKVLRMALRNAQRIIIMTKISNKFWENCLSLNGFARQIIASIHSSSLVISLLSLLFSASLQAGTLEQAKRIHERLAGVPPSKTVLLNMKNKLDNGDGTGAALDAIENSFFYTVTLKNFVTPWTNEAETVFAPLNDYSATVIGIIRDDIDFREILSGDILYVGDPSLNIPSYANTSNAHYQALEDQHLDLKQNLVKTTQSAVTSIPAEATAGITTTRAAAQAFFIDGTNRAMFRFTLKNQLCTDLEPIKDITRSPDRIRQDVSRSPGGDSRIFLNNCIGCHSGMDPMTQAFAYYNFTYDSTNDPDATNGRLSYNSQGTIDPDTGSRVQKKYHINADNFKFGYITENDHWDNYWRFGPNANLGWSSTLTGTGDGAKSMGKELANSQAFASCQVKKVFENVCLRQPVDTADRTQIASMPQSFQSNNYRLKQVFAESAVYCMGD